MEATKQRKWALKFMYSMRVSQYAGDRWPAPECENDPAFGYEGVGRDLTRAKLFNSQQEALQDMLRTYRNVDSGAVYPIPVPVIVETKTVTEIYEEDSVNDPD